MSKTRIKRLNEVLRLKLAEIIQKEFDFGDEIITVVGVSVSSSMQHARVMISVLPESKTEEVFKEISSNIYKIQKELIKRLKLRKTPKITFELDRTEEKAAKIEKILSN